MQLAADKTMRHAVTGSLAVHVLAFLLLVLGLHQHLGSETERPDEPADEFVLVLDAMPQFEPEPPPEPLPEPEPEPDSEPEPEPDALDPRRQFVVADHVQPAAEAPDDARFEADRDTVAGSRIGPDPDGPADMPSLRGDSPVDTLSTIDAAFQDGDEPAPPPVPAPAEPVPPVAVAVPVPEPAPQPQPLPEPELAAVATPVDPADLLTDPTSPESLQVAEADEVVEPEQEPEMAEADTEARPDELPPDPAEEAEPQQEMTDSGEQPDPAQDEPAPQPVMLESFEPSTPRQPEQRVAEQRGGAQLSEVDSFLAMQTAEGEYKRQLYGVIERRWRRLTNQNLAMKTYSQVKVAVVIERDGSILSARITESAASPAMREAALRAVRDGSLPPVPEQIPAPYYYAMEFLVY